jgi:hypothetical protein
MVLDSGQERKCKMSRVATHIKSSSDSPFSIDLYMKWADLMMSDLSLLIGGVGGCGANDLASLIARIAMERLRAQSPLPCGMEGAKREAKECLASAHTVGSDA